MIKNPSDDEVKRLNEELELRHYEFRSNCRDGEGDAMACHSWGEWLGVVDKDYKGAAKVYKMNCEKKGYPASCFNLGKLMVSGKGMPMNDAGAIDLFEKACASGHGQGCHHLGFMYSNGLGRPKDLDKALDAYKKACTLDESNSCYRVASMYLAAREATGKMEESRSNQKLTATNSGTATPKVNGQKSAERMPSRDVAVAKQYLEKACNANFAPACHNLAVMYKKGDDVVGPDEAKFKEYQEKTAALVAQAGGMAGIRSS